MSEESNNALLIVGAGYTGRVAARQAVESGWSVVGTTRKAATARALEELGAKALYWDIADDGAAVLDWNAQGRKTALYSLPTLFDSYDGSGEIPRHVAPVIEVMDRVESLGAERFVYISSTAVYGDHGGDWVDESAERSPTSPYGKMRKEIEDAVLGRDGPMQTFVVRAVGIYGPGRTLDRYISSGRYKLVDGGTKPGNRIHVDDLAGICWAVLGGDFEEPRDFIATDGQPIPVVELVDFIVEKTGVERPEEVSLEEYAKTRSPNVVARWANVSRFRSSRVEKVLGYEFAYRDVLEGYRELLG